MGISFGSTGIKPYVGSKEVKEAYVGSQLVYKGKPNPVTLFNGAVSKAISPNLIWAGTAGYVDGAVPRAYLAAKPGIKNGYWCKGKFEYIHIKHEYPFGALYVHFYKNDIDIGKVMVNYANQGIKDAIIDVKNLASKNGYDYDGVGVSGLDGVGFSTNFIMMY